MSAWDEPWGNLHPFKWLRENCDQYLSDTAVSICQKSVPFDYETLPDSGVYFWVDGGRIVYVGQSTELHFRHGTHYSKHWREPEYIYVIDVPKKFMSHVETYYIHLLTPLINRKRPHIQLEYMEDRLNQYGICSKSQVVDGVTSGDAATVLLHPEGGLVTVRR